jgi:hypothetical protein
MQIACPECQKQLRLPERLAGKLVKCPGCGGKFKANESEPEEVATIPAKAPKGSPAVGSKQRDLEPGTRRRAAEPDDIEEDASPRRRRRPRDNATDEPTPSSRRFRDAGVEAARDPEERKEVRRKARQRTKGAGILLLVAGLFLFGAVALNISASMHLETKYRPHQQPTYKQALYGSAGLGMLAAFCHLLASASLRSFRMKAFVPVSVALGILFACVCGYGVFFNLQLVAVIPAEDALLVTSMIVAFGVTGLLNLLAALMTILALRNSAVDQAYRAA